VIPAKFEYKRASSAQEAISLVGEHGDEAKLLAGGHSLLPMMKLRLASPAVLVDIGRLTDLSYIRDGGNHLAIGALTRHRDVETSAVVKEHAPLLAHATSHVGDPQVRHRGTIGGSLAHADPAAELPACCVALEATIVARSAAGERRIRAAQFFTGLYATALAANEMIAAIEFPIAKAGERSVILELARRSGDYAMAGIVARAKLAGSTLVEPSLVLFGVGDRPVSAERATGAVAGKIATAETIAAAQAALDADLDPPADQHGGPDMKRHLARVLLARALRHLTGAQEARAA
jgi:carbon-monoxide dehydrogenase medium subunit